MCTPQDTHMLARYITCIMIIHDIMHFAYESRGLWTAVKCVGVWVVGCGSPPVGRRRETTIAVIIITTWGRNLCRPRKYCSSGHPPHYNSLCVCVTSVLWRLLALVQWRAALACRLPNYVEIIVALSSSSPLELSNLTLDTTYLRTAVETRQYTNERVWRNDDLERLSVQLLESGPLPHKPLNEISVESEV